MTTKEITLTEDPCIFHQTWWLEAVAPGRWEILKIEKGGQIFASMPYIKKKKFGLTFINMPLLTQHLGPWIKPLPGKYSSRLSKEKELMNDLIKQLPKFDFFRQRFSPNITNWLPFYWSKFEQTTRYTYQIEDISDPDKLWKGMQGNIRREIKKARNKVQTKHSDDAETMWKLCQMNFEEKNESMNTSLKTFLRLDAACREHEARQIFFAIDKDGNIHAGLYLVWDKESAYYLMGGADPKFRTSGAASLLMFEAIKFASQKTKRFDFEGSMIESVERFFRGFGGRQQPLFEITKCSKKIDWIVSGRNVIKKFL